MELNGPATLRQVQTSRELAGAGDYVIWADGSMTIRCPFCGQETWFNPAPVMCRGPLTLNGAVKAVCGHRYWILDGKAELA